LLLLSAFLLLLGCFLFWPKERPSLSHTHRHGNQSNGGGGGISIGIGNGSNGERRLSSFFSTRARLAARPKSSYRPALRFSVPLGRLSTVKSICQKSLTAAYSQNTHTHMEGEGLGGHGWPSESSFAC